MYTIIKVNKDSSQELKERVYRLRKKVYVDEMKFPIDTMVDEYDEKSTSLLIVRNQEDVGTIRITFLKDRSMEIFDQQEHWKQVAYNLYEPNTMGEFNRFAVIQQERGGAASLYLMQHVYFHTVTNGVYNIIAAGKVGNLTKNYKKYLGKVIDTKQLAYYMNNYKLGNYVLMHFDFGRPGSLRRLYVYFMYGIMGKLIAYTKIFNLLLKRGPGYRSKK